MLNVRLWKEHVQPITEELKLRGISVVNKEPNGKFWVDLTLNVRDTERNYWLGYVHGATTMLLKTEGCQCFG